MKIGLQAWGTEGDIQPFTALATGLVNAGHEITLVVTDNAARDYSEAARRSGYRLITVPIPDLPSPEQLARLWRSLIDLGNPIRQAEMIMKHDFDPAAEAMYAASRELCARNDAVIGHFFVYPLRVASEKAGVPAATLNIVHYCLPSARICPPGFPDLGRWSYSIGWKLTRTMINRIYLPRVNALRKREGLQPDTDVMSQTWAADRLNLIAVSPQICRRPADWEARHQICGFLNLADQSASDDLPQGLDAFLSAGSPPVYLTFGSMMIDDLAYIRETAILWAAAIRLAGCRAILQLPWHDLSAFETDERMFKVRRSPYLKVFPRCAMVVHHGGAGTTQSALLSGRPSIVVAHLADQSFWGADLERLGVAGKTLKRKSLTARQLSAGITSVLARPGIASRAREIGDAMAKEDGVSAAIGLIRKNLLSDFPAAKLA